MTTNLINGDKSMAEKHVFTFVQKSDEAFEVTLNDKFLGAFNHDQDGWGGMETVERLVAAIAKEIGAQVVTEYPEDVED